MRSADGEELGPLLGEQAAYYRAIAAEYYDHVLDLPGGEELTEALDAFAGDDLVQSARHLHKRGVERAAPKVVDEDVLRLVVMVERYRCAYSKPAADGSLRSATTSKPALAKASSVRNALEALAGTLIAACMRSPGARPAFDRC